jgi:signal transduction histidine kinase/transcriptional regulator with GAF, ATPase, and Fis domain
MYDISSAGFSYQRLNDLEHLSEALVSASLSEFLRVFPEMVCKILDVPICIIWQKQLEKPRFNITATYGDVDEEYKQIELDFAHPSVASILSSRREKILILSDVSQAKHRLVNMDKIRSRKWISLMSKTLQKEDDVIGIINIFTRELRNFNEWEKSIFNILACQATNFLKSTLDNEKILNEKNKLEMLTNIILEMTRADESDSMWDLLYKGVLAITEHQNQKDIQVILAKINHLDGNLDIKRKSNTTMVNSKSILGKGIITMAIKQELPVIVNDVLSDNRYVEQWKNARSEIAIPLIDRTLIREGKQVKSGSKCIGVINIESSEVNAFSAEDKKHLSLLADCASIVIERRSFRKKISAIRELEKEISKAQNYGAIIDRIIEGITGILQFEWVNISLVDADRNMIRSEHVAGMSNNLIKEFKKEAEHPLGNGEKDIQADIIRNREIEVPDPEDPRFDRKIYGKYGHNKLVRIFLPLIEPSSNLAIGTVEAGYPREYRKHIYEQDITILKSLVDYTAHALERKKSGLIDRISHELKSPIVGIRANASFLQTRFNDERVSKQLITIKFEDILTDCELLTYQIRQFEYFMGRNSFEKIRREEVNVFRDIVIKTIYQLKSYIQEEYGFSIDGITYNVNDSRRIIVYTDKVKLNQVVYNLILNAIKYSERDPNLFKILIEVDEDRDFFVIKIKDSGIGIKERDKIKVFEEGFRSLEATSKVEGSGLGLSISRTIMRQLGGDLKLINSANPTEFHIIIPKKAKEV